MLFAHAKWFAAERGHDAVDWPFLLSAWTLAPIAGATAAVVFALRRPAPARLRRAAPPDAVLALVPHALRVAVALALLVLAVDRRLLVPSPAPLNEAAILLPAQALVAAWLLSGVRITAAAWALIGFVASAALLTGPLALVEAAYYAGAGAYLILHERSRARLAPPSAPWRALAVALGGSLVVVAFTEKLAVPSISLAVLHGHPVLDPLTLAGVAMPPETWVRVAGLAELLVGLLVATGAGGRLVPLALIGPLAATVAVFGVPELVGHLPLYVALVAVAARTEPQRISIARITAPPPDSSTRPGADPAPPCSRSL